MGEKAKATPDKHLGFLLIKAARSYKNKLSAKLTIHNLVAGQEVVLQRLSAHGPLSIGQLADFLCVRPPTVSKTITRLEASGLIERLPSTQQDNRIVRVTLTELGRQKAQLLEIISQEAEDALLSSFNKKEQKRFRKFLRRTLKTLASPEDTSQPINHDE